MATVATWNAEKIRALRRALRLKQADLAAEVHVDVRTVKRWEAGSNIGSDSLADLDALVAQASPETRQRFVVLAGGDDDVDRRQLLAIAAAAPVAPGLLTLGLSGEQSERKAWLMSGAGKPDRRSVDLLRSTLWSAMQLDDTLGSPAAQGMTVAQQEVTEAVLRECDGVVRTAVISLHAEWLGFAGCLAWDAGEHAAAARMYHLALDTAHDAEDADLAAYMHCHLAQLAIWQDRPRVALDHAVAARSWVGDSHDMRLRAYADLRMAQAAALARQTRACLDALDRADREIGSGVSTAHPSESRAYFVSSALLESYRGECLLAIGDARSGVAATRRSIDMFAGEEFRRDKAMTLLDLEQALIRLGDIDEAAHAVAEAVELSDRCRSPRLAGAIMDARRALSPWAGSDAIRDLDSRLAARDMVLA